MYDFYDYGERASYLRFADMLEDVIKSERVFPWPEDEVAQFEASRTKRLLRSILVNVYRFGLKVLLKIKNVTGVKFGIGLEDRIENYAVAEKKKQYDKVNRESFDQIYRRLQETVKQ